MKKIIMGRVGEVLRKYVLLLILCSVFFIKPLASSALFKDSIIIIGSEPECIAAAVTASKLGYHVSLITEADRPGGLLVDGMLTALDINYDDNNQIIHKGYFKEFLDACGNGSNIDYEKTKTFFNESLKNYAIDGWYNVTELRPIVHNNKITGAYFMADGKTRKIYSKYIIDGSSEAAFIRKLGIPYKKGRSEFGQPNKAAAATLIFSVKGADWDKIVDCLKNDNNFLTGSRGNAAWGFNQMYHYKASCNQLQMRGLNLSKQNDGSIIINALLIFNVDSSNKESLDKAYILAKNELPSVIQYLAKHCPGFEKASLNKVAQKLYIREGVRIVSIDTLSSNDIFNHTDFPNTIAYGSYPIDLQATQQGEYGNALGGKSLYSIPFGAMITPKADNILVIGRSAGFDIIAHGSARTVPVLMSMAENGMVAVDYCIKNKLSLSELNASHQDFSRFIDQLNDFNGFTRLPLPKNQLNERWYYPYIHDLRSRGYFSLGYIPYSLDDIKYGKKAINATLALFKAHSCCQLPQECLKFMSTLNSEISTYELCKIISHLCKSSFYSMEDLYKHQMIDQTTYENVSSNGTLSPAEIYAVLDCTLKKINPYIPVTVYKDKIDAIAK